MSRWDLMLAGDPTPPRPDAAVADFVDAFFQSAESVLRDEFVTFPFSEIADKGMRRRLASELFLSSDGLGPGWMAMFRTAIGELAATMPLDAVADHPWLKGEQDRDPHDEWWPCCIHYYLNPEDGSLSDLRHRAWETFMFLVELAIVEAHSVGPMSRVRVAWAVLDGIDRRERLLPLLRKFLGVGKSAVQLSTRISPFVEPWRLHKGWNVVRRLLRTMAAMPKDMRPASVSLQGASVFSMLFLSVVAGAARVAVGSLFPVSRGVCATLRSMRDVSKKERSVRLRRQVKMLKAVGARGWEIRLQQDLETPWHDVAPMVTPSGWHAIPIKGHKALVVEGEEMSHCVATYSRALRRGEAIVLSLRSTILGQRATLVVEDDKARLLGDDEFEDAEAQRDVPWLRFTLAGPGNRWPSYAAYRAALEVLEAFPPHALKMSMFGGVRRDPAPQTPACMGQSQERTGP